MNDKGTHKLFKLVVLRHVQQNSNCKLRHLKAIGVLEEYAEPILKELINEGLIIKPGKTKAHTTQAGCDYLLMEDGFIMVIPPATKLNIPDHIEKVRIKLFEFMQTMVNI